MIIKYGFLSFLLLLVIASCTKISETEIGTGLIPPADGVITKDTDIVVYTKNSSDTDTVRPVLYDDHALGYINDPLFGTTTAAINVQMQPSVFPFTFEAGSSSLILDSVVLALDVRSSWGDTTQPLSLHVKEIDNSQPFTADSTLIIYNNNSQIAASNDITYNGVKSVDSRLLNDSFHVFEDSGTNMLRIRLSDEFGNRLLHTYDSANQYKTDSAFRVAFRGFQISADAVGNSLLRIGLTTSSATAEANTKMAIYYRYTNSSGTLDTAVKYFTVNPSTSAHSNYIHREVGSSAYAAYHPLPTAAPSDDYIYLQANPNTFATIRIDSLSIRNLPNWIIHRAEIVMEQAPDAGSTVLDNLTAPYLFMLVKDNNGTAFINDTTKFVIPGFDSVNSSTFDASFSSLLLANYSDFGGIPFRKNNSEGTSINYYNFNVSRYIQGILTNKNLQYTFTLYAPYREYFRLVKGVNSYARVVSSPLNSAGIGRVRLYGGGTDVSNTHRMKLHIVYSLPH